MTWWWYLEAWGEPLFFWRRKKMTKSEATDFYFCHLYSYEWIWFVYFHIILFYFFQVHQDEWTLNTRREPFECTINWNHYAEMCSLFVACLLSFCLEHRFFFCYSMFQPMAMGGRRGSWTYEDALVSCFIRWAEIWECSKCIFHPMPWICIRFRWLIAKCSDSLMTAIHKFFLRRKHCLTLSNFHDFFLFASL